MLPTGATDRLTAVFVQCVVNDHQDLTSLGVQRLDQNPEKAIRYKLNAPSTLSQKSVNSGKMPRMMETHGQNHLADRVPSHGQRPTYQKGYKDTKTRSGETPHKSNLVNSKRICYFLFHLGVPPSPLFVSKKRVHAERLVFQPLFTRPTVFPYKKGETIVINQCHKNSFLDHFAPSSLVKMLTFFDRI